VLDGFHHKQWSVARCQCHASVSLSRVHLLLASASPRRAGLLTAAGFSFDVVPADVDEQVLPGEDPDSHVLRLARAKVRAVTSAAPGSVILGADTIVLVDGEILGKPGDDARAASMLRRLSGRGHEVLTGVAIRRGDHEESGVERTSVRFLPLSDREIAWYISTGEARDKAGAYGAQGLASRFIERIDGSYSNVVGLPVPLVCRLLNRLGELPGWQWNEWG
jgi:nucleoside triphosphate pyrophosphatase